MIWQYTCPLPRICIHNEYMGVITQHTNNPSSCKGVCTHLQSNIWDLWTLPSTRSGPVYGQASQIKVQHVPRATGQGLAHAAGQAGQGWGAQPPSTSPVKGFPHRQKGRGAGGTASTDTAQSVYLGGHFLEAQESAKKLWWVLQALLKAEVLNGPVKLASDTRKYQCQHFW